MMEAGREIKLERGPGRGRMCAARPGLAYWGRGQLNKTKVNVGRQALQGQAECYGQRGCCAQAWRPHRTVARSGSH